MIWLFVLMLSQAHAQIFEGPVAAALGGSGRAGLDANEGVFLNPALVAILPESELDGYYRDGDADVGQHRQAYGASISENTEENLLAGELSYLRLRNTGTAPTPVNSEVWQASMGKLFYKRFAVGVSVIHVDHSPEDAPAYAQWNGSLGALFSHHGPVGDCLCL